MLRQTKAGIGFAEAARFVFCLPEGLGVLPCGGKPESGIPVLTEFFPRRCKKVPGAAKSKITLCNDKAVICLFHNG